MIESAKFLSIYSQGDGTMKQAILVIIGFALLLGLCACATVENSPTWQEQYDLGVRYLSEGNYEEAIIAFTAAIEIDHKRAEAYIGCGDAYVGKEDYTEAISSFTNALEVDSMQAEVYIKIAECYVVLSDMASAIDFLKAGIMETDADILKLKLQKYENQLIPEEITVLKRQFTTKYNYISRGQYGDKKDFSQDECIYEYNEEGYMVHVEKWNCDYAPWSSVSGEWILSSSEDMAYDQELAKWIHKGYRRYVGELEPTTLHHYDIGTHSYYTLESDGDVCVCCNPYPANPSDVIYNAEYNDTGFYDFDWYSAKYTYDKSGNVIKIESYSIDESLLGVCDLEYETMRLK